MVNQLHKFIKNNPVLFILCILILVFLIGKFPIKENIGHSEFTSEKLESVILYTAVLALSVIIINRFCVPHSYFHAIELKKYLYYLPVVLCIYLYTGGFGDLNAVDVSRINSWKGILLGMSTLSSGMFEEVLFRGLILGVLLNRYHNSKHGIVKSVIISCLIFGLIHIVNIWTKDQSLRGTLNQAYAAFSLGILYSAVYLKTKSIIMGVLHTVHNFLGSLPELTNSAIIINSTGNKTDFEIILSSILVLLIFGIPLIMGFIILKITKRRIGGVNQTNRLIIFCIHDYLNQ